MIQGKKCFSLELFSKYRSLLMGVAMVGIFLCPIVSLMLIGKLQVMREKRVGLA